jgi:hypothetical protein
MKLAIVAIGLAAIAGRLSGGRLANLASVRIRWTVLALIGLALQVAPVPGRALSMGLLYVSFALLLVFAMVNLRLVGFPLILLGITLNFTVIAANGGMPVTRHALVASGQQDTLTLLVDDGGAKHHLASSQDVLLPLADVIAVRGIDQAISVGDVATYTGVMWLIVWGMRRRTASPADSPSSIGADPAGSPPEPARV